MKLVEKAHAVLIERGVESIMWGDGLMVDVANEIGVKLRNPHPLNMMSRVCALMRTAPHLFEHSYVKGHDHRGHMRIVNRYKVKPKV